MCTTDNFSIQMSWFLKNIFIYYFLFNVWVLCLHLGAPLMWLVPNEALDSLGLKLQTVISHLLGAGSSVREKVHLTSEPSLSLLKQFLSWTGN